jgi:carbamoylphosphate synthase large subunit
MDMKKLLVIETDGMDEVVKVCETNDWKPVFIKTESYSQWLPVNGNHQQTDVKNYKRLSYFDVVKEAADNEVQSILPVSLLEPEAVRDSLVKDYFQTHKIPVNIVANSPAAMEATFDKGLTKEILAHHGVPVTPGRQLYAMEEVDEAIEGLGFPLIVKERKSYTGMGVRIVNDIAELKKHLTKNISKGVYIEPFIEGSEVSVEVITWKGVHSFQPLVYKGETRVNIIEHPAYRPRVAPYRQGTPLESKIISIVKRAVDILQLNGAAEFEFIVVNDEPFIMEVNPRISGVSRLCNASGGINVFRALTMIAINDRLDAGVSDSQKKFAIQFPLTIIPEGELLDSLKSRYNVHYVKPITWMPFLPIKSNIIVSFDTEEALLAGINHLSQYSDEKYLAEAKRAVNYF